MTIDNLIFDKESDTFETIINNGDKSFDLTLCDFKKGDEVSATRLANKICAWLDINFDNAKKYAARELIEAKNDNWLEEDELPITESQFMETIEFDGILAFSDDSFQIFFDDGKLFAGHHIVVDVDKKFNFEGVDIAG